MDYTINKLAKLSGVTIRTLRFYDEINLLKPAYVADNGYRYYQEAQLLYLQQILFFRELGFELQQIKKILTQTDFDKLKALQMHKKVLQQNIIRMNALIQTIDTTVNHLKNKTALNEEEIFHGFSDEQQAHYKQYLITQFGDTAKMRLEQSDKNTQGWAMDTWKNSHKEINNIWKELNNLLTQQFKTDSCQVQAVIQKHYNWLTTFWTPDKESYIQLGKMYTEREWQKSFEQYDPQFAVYLAEAMNIFAQEKL